MIPILVFTPLARKMVVKFGKKELSIVGAICSIIGAAGLFIVVPNSKELDLVLYVVCQLVYSLGLGIYSTVSWAMMGDAIDYNEWKTGEREEGVVYSLHSFFRKLAQGLGPAMALLIMAPLGYVNNAYELKDGTVVGPFLYKILEDGSYEVSNVLNPLYDPKLAESIVPSFFDAATALNMRYLVAALYLVAAIMQFVGLALVYNLDKKTLATMNEELKARKNAEAAK
jgi:GPH family glycoside/pentoside/hexuronide:cation symporter